MLPAEHRAQALALPDKPRSAKFMEAHGLNFVLEAMRAAYLGRIQWPLVFAGETGAGKTCAGLLLHDGTGGRYWHNFLDFCDEVRRARTGQLMMTSLFAQSVIPETEFWRTYEEANFVVLDEIGTHARSEADVSQHQTDCLHRALTTRLDRRNPQLLLITNRNLDDVADLYGAPIASRMRAGTIVEFKGDKRKGADE